MQRIGLNISAIIFTTLLFLGGAGGVNAAASDFCLCTDNLERVTTDNYASMGGTLKAGYFCKEKIKQDQCTVEGIKTAMGSTYDSCTNNFDNETSCTDAYATWKLNFDAKLKAAASATKG